MNRDDFIHSVWKPYLPMKKSHSTVWGRVTKLSETGCLIKNQKQSDSIEFINIKEQVDDYWGHAIPCHLLALGDVVVFDHLKKSMYLLSPSLNKDVLVDPNALKWSEFLDQVDGHFKALGFNHLRTPYLVPCPGVDHHIDPLSVVATKSQQKFFLPTSPEIHLKKYLCQGYENLFEIKNCFRDDFKSPYHRTEFTMLEWYRAFSDLNDILDDVKSLFLAVFKKPLMFREVSLFELFKEQLHFDLKPDTSIDELRSLLGQNNLHWTGDDDWNDLFFRIYIEKIEPALDIQKVTVIKDFPPTQASLSQINNEGWSERFEIYYQGVELANAYLEVNNPQENRARFQTEADLRHKKGVQPVFMDQDYFDKLSAGMPPAAGIALGLDRLFMLQNQDRDIGR